jgi:dTDP-4-amino-4,6-dideoxygalactose transaminase
MTVPFVDLQIQSTRLRQEILSSVERTLDEGQFILGDEVASFEQAFAEFNGVDHCIGVGNGTEALHLTLRALGIGPGDEVITAANTFVATALAISYTGATPALVDVDEYSLIDVDLLERAITRRTKAILPVHLYGQPADMPAILDIARNHELAVVSDACQAHGARLDGEPVASFGDAACFSFYPSKNLGACGDGGAVVTSSGELAERIRMLRNYGQQTKNNYAMLGYNSRLDTLQAAILKIKLDYLDEGNRQRRAAAAMYGQLLQHADITLPAQRPGASHVFHLYVVRHPQRDELLSHLQQSGVQAGIHYPTPIHQIPSFTSAVTVPEGAPVSSRFAKQILSLPMYPGISRNQIERVANEVLAFTERLAVA